MDSKYCFCDYCEKKDRCPKDELDILFKVMDNENDVTLTDGKGIVIRVSESYSGHYGVEKKDIVGKSVLELEGEGVFKPSVTAAVLEKKKKVTLLQENKFGEKILTTGVPLFDDNGDIKHVISFNSIDIAEMGNLFDNYNKANELMKGYLEELQHMRLQNIEESGFIARSQSMADVNKLIMQVANTSANVLLTGETGVGKSFIAKMLHEESNRAEEAFVEINCGAIPEALIESELFGYEKGAFTGADTKGKIGKIELANKGTLFLDEIGELPLDMQVKLLQVIQNKEFTRVGGLEKIKVDFRLVAATNVDLKKAIEEGKFRKDLYYRINVISTDIPSLRDRKEDIIPLIMNFLNKFNSIYNKKISFSEEALKLLESYTWPGNIRQVENFIERTVVISRNDIVNSEDLPDEIQRLRLRPAITGKDSLGEMIEKYEKEIFIDALQKYKTSIAVGKALGISQTTAARKLRKYVPGYVNEKNSRF